VGVPAIHVNDPLTDAKLSLPVLDRISQLNLHNANCARARPTAGLLQYDAIARIACATLGLGTVAFDYLAK
jgi:hypothetical protein